MISLKVLQVHVNLLEGSPFEIIRTMKQLQHLDLSENGFTGSIPDDSMFIELSYLKTFAIGNNCFSGFLPQSICDAKNLTMLVLSGLTSGKACRTNIKRLGF